MLKLTNEDVAPYDIGYILGYNDTCPSDGICPFEKYTEEYSQFWEGYEDGAWEC